MKYQLKWTKSMSVHQQEIDKQHKHLFSIINRVVDAHLGRLDSNAIYDCLKELMDYSAYHFNQEMKYMAEYQFPKIDAHIDEHLTYTTKMGALLDEFKKGHTHIDEELLSYLAQWWTNHVMKEDMRYAEYIAYVREQEKKAEKKSG